MFKKMLPLLAVMMILTIICGCACGTGTAQPTPTPTARPTETPLSSTSPDAVMEPSASPDAGIGPSMSPDVNATGESATIPNFSEGTEVQETDVPKVSQAVKEQYPNAEIVSIKHATQTDKQVYAVVIKTSGTERTVYVQPDGTLADGATASPAQ